MTDVEVQVIQNYLFIEADDKATHADDGLIVTEPDFSAGYFHAHFKAGSSKMLSGCCGDDQNQYSASLETPPFRVVYCLK
jgi:hypothetical protein